MTDVQAVWKLLQSERYTDKILHLKHTANYSFGDKIGASGKKKWFIILADKDFLDNMQSLGCIIIGLDTIFKASK